MSNFICSECGMKNIDCGGAGYKTPKEIELEKENKRLQEQLNEANEVIKEYADSSNWTREYNEYSCTIKEDCVFYDSEGWKDAKDYLDKWGVK